VPTDRAVSPSIRGSLPQGVWGCERTDARPLYWGPFPLSHSSADVVMCCLVVDVVIGLGYDGRSFRGLRDLAHVRGPRDCPWNARGISNTQRYLRDIAHVEGKNPIVITHNHTGVLI
jgi:hypothetical protein